MRKLILFFVLFPASLLAKILPSDDLALKTLHSSFTSPSTTLTLFLNSIVFEQTLKVAEKRWVGPSPELMEKAFVGLLKYWVDAIQRHRDEAAPGPDLTTDAVIKAYSKQLSMDPNERAILERELRYSLGDRTLTFLQSVQNLELTRFSSKEKVLRVLQNAKVAASYEESFLGIAATLGVSFAYSNDSQVALASLDLLSAVAKKTKELQGIAIATPEMLLGIGGLYRTLVFPAINRIVLWTASFKSSTVALTGTAAVHSGALVGALLQPSEAQKQADAKLAAAELNQQREKLATEIKKTPILGSNNGEPSSRLVYDSTEMLQSKAFHLLKAYEYWNSDINYLDLIFSAEQEYQFSHTISANIKGDRMQSLQKATVEAKMNSAKIRENLKKRAESFDLYMQKRNLKEMDNEALVHLRSLETDLVSNYNPDQSFALPLFAGPSVEANCVGRLLVHTAFFYPLFQKYKPKNIEFGLYVMADHVEAVLRNMKTDETIAIQGLDSFKVSLNEEEPEDRGPIPTLFSPKIIAASYLLKRFQLAPFKFDDLVIQDSDITVLSKARFEKFQKSSCNSQGNCNGANDVSYILDRFINLNPLLSGQIRDPIFRLRLASGKAKKVLRTKARNGEIPTATVFANLKANRIKTESVLFGDSSSESNTEISEGQNSNRTSGGGSNTQSGNRSLNQLGNEVPRNLGFPGNSGGQEQGGGGNQSAISKESGALNSGQAISPTAIFAAQQRTKEFMIGKPADGVASQVRIESNCVVFESGMKACARKINQFLSFPITSSRSGFEVFTESGLVKELPFRDEPGFFKFYVGTAKNFFATAEYIKMKSSLSDRTSPAAMASIDSLISTMNLFGIAQLYRTSSLYENSKKKFFETEGVQAIAQEEKEIRSTLMYLIEDRSGSAFKRFFESQIFADAQQTLKQNIALNIWYSTLQSLEFDSLRQLMSRVVFTVKKMNPSKAANEKFDQQTVQGNSTAQFRIQWLTHLKAKPETKSPQIPAPQVQAKTADPTEKIAIHVDSLSGLLAATTLGGVLEEKETDSLIAQLKLSDVALSAKKIGARLATLDIYRSIVFDWFSHWTHSFVTCDEQKEEAKTERCKNSEAIAASLLSNAK